MNTDNCTWTFITHDGFGWFESTCGLMGDDPGEDDAPCPGCGRPITCEVEDMESLK